MITIDTNARSITIDCTLRTREEWERFVAGLNGATENLWEDPEPQPAPESRKRKKTCRPVKEPAPGTRAAKMLEALRNGDAPDVVAKKLGYKLMPVKLWASRWRNAGILK